MWLPREGTGEAGKAGLGLDTSSNGSVLPGAAPVSSCLVSGPEKMGE